MTNDINRENRRATSECACLLCGYQPSDPHHWPIRRSHGAGDGRLEMVPICRRCHDAIHGGDTLKIELLETSGKLYHDYLRRIGVTE